jgi:hypothetical protein
MKISTIIKKATTLHGIEIQPSKTFSSAKRKFLLIEKTHLESLVRYAQMVGFSEGYTTGKSMMRSMLQKKNPA